MDYWIDEYVKDNEKSEPPKRLKTWCAISCLAATIRRRSFFDMGKSHKLYPNMYIVLVAPAGARKGTAVNQMTPYLKELGDINLSSDSLTKERLTVEISEAEDSYFRDGKQVMDKSITAIAEEMVVFLSEKNQDMLGDMLRYFDCPDDFKRSTKASGKSDMKNVCVNLLCATTPDGIRSHLPKSARGDGWLSRTMHIYADGIEQIIHLPWRDTNKEILNKDLLAKLKEIQAECNGPFDATKQFDLAWIKWRDEHEKERIFSNTLLETYHDRRPIQLLKLSMIYCASRLGNLMMTDEDLHKAQTVLCEAESHMMKAFSKCGRNVFKSEAEEIVKYLQKNGRKALTRTLFYHMQDRIDHNVFQSLMKTLDSYGVIEIKKTKKTGADKKPEYVAILQ